MKALFFMMVFLLFIVGCCPECGIEIDYTGDERSEEELTADCEDKGGKFNSCASSCPPDAEACIAVCVPKCEFEK